MTESERAPSSVTYEAVRDAIQWDQAPWPSNRRTLQQMRSHLFLVGNLRDDEVIARTLNEVAEHERMLVADGIDHALGKPSPPRHIVPDTQDILVDLYQEVGIAKGPHEAKEMAKLLFEWAVAEALKHVPDRPR